jgi:hypothetical protein
MSATAEKASSMVKDLGFVLEDVVCPSTTETNGTEPNMPKILQLKDEGAEAEAGAGAKAESKAGAEAEAEAGATVGLETQDIFYATLYVYG